jgi:hypothetical protein
MLVRIRFGTGPTLRVGRKRGQTAAQAMAALMAPIALMALALAVWSIAAQMKLSGHFAISSGAFSYWQTWLVMAAAFQLLSRALGKYGKDGDEASV